eukprot:4713335-Prymnesium_polylepis.1
MAHRRLRTNAFRYRGESRLLTLAIATTLLHSSQNCNAVPSHADAHPCLGRSDNVSLAPGFVKNRWHCATR